MTSTGRNARLTRLGRRRRSEQGLTLIELLLAVAILTLLTGFLAGGLSIGRRAFDADRTSEIASETDAAIKIISSLIASALPVRTNATNQKSGMVFDGRQNSLSFVALSEGRSLRGGPHKISLRRSGEDFVVDVVGPAAAAARGGARAGSDPGGGAQRGPRNSVQLFRQHGPTGGSQLAGGVVAC